MWKDDRLKRSLAVLSPIRSPSQGSDTGPQCAKIKCFCALPGSAPPAPEFRQPSPFTGN